MRRGAGKSQRYQCYKVDVRPGWTVLDALHEIKWNQDGTLTFRRSCRHGICGSCAMQINGLNALACETQIKDLKRKPIVVDPLPGFKVIKDLAVDMDPFFELLERVKPYLINDALPPAKERIQSPEDFAKISSAINCILCSACTSSCPSYWADKSYLGPAALLKAYRYIFDTRDQGSEERINALDNQHGLWRCHTIINCVDACPKDLAPTEAISRLKNRIVSEKY
ncbi:succinate dehydrogenase iron-sulfur subunit [bacterium]|nr:succinate dehydrogenase iron-sulfur subunit [FCB group bacterium]MBL7190687.1 succinate dehydrogenase iron-sulfur subunit [bacterium]